MMLFVKQVMKVINFLPIAENEFALVYEIDHKNNRYFVAFNADTKEKLSLNLPDGWWNVLADEKSVKGKNHKSINNEIILNPSTGIILKKK